MTLADLHVFFHASLPLLGDQMEKYKMLKLCTSEQAANLLAFSLTEEKHAAVRKHW